MKLIPHFHKKGLLLVLRSSGITLIGVIALIVMGVKINTVTAEIVKSHNQLALVTTKLERFDMLKKDAELVEGVTTKMNSAIPTMDTMPTVVDYINTLGVLTQTTVSVQFDSRGRVNADNTLGKISFSLQASGPVPLIENLFKKIENSPYLINIESITLSMLDIETNLADVKARGYVYIQSTNQ